MASLDTPQEVDGQDDERVGENLAPFNPSSQPVVESALRLLCLMSTDVLYELGCGKICRFLRQHENILFYRFEMNVVCFQNHVL